MSVAWRGSVGTCNVSVSRDWDRHSRSVDQSTCSHRHDSVGLTLARPNYFWPFQKLERIWYVKICLLLWQQTHDIFAIALYYVIPKVMNYFGQNGVPVFHLWLIHLEPPDWTSQILPLWNLNVPFMSCKVSSQVLMYREQWLMKCRSLEGSGGTFPRKCCTSSEVVTVVTSTCKHLYNSEFLGVGGISQGPLLCETLG